MSELPKLPGQELEKAAGQVLIETSRSLSEALRELFGAWSERISAPNRAMAEEIRKNAAHSGDLRRSKELLDEQRRQEIEEIDHRLNLLARAKGRTDDLHLHEQRSVEYVIQKSIENNKSDPNKHDERKIEKDWLRRFFKYVSEVDEDTILDVLAEALNQAAIKGPPVLSPKALDTLRFCDGKILEIFEFCAKELTMFNAVPATYLEARAEKLGISLDIQLLLELGLLKEERTKFYEVILGYFGISFFYDAGERFDFSLIKLTYVGKSIENLIGKAFYKGQKLYSIPRNGSKILDFQLMLGLDAEVAHDLGVALISDLAESWAIGMEALIYLPTPEKVFSSERRTLDKPFGLNNITNLDLLNEQNIAIVKAFVDPFNYFDNHQLRTMVRKD